MRWWNPWRDAREYRKNAEQALRIERDALERDRKVERELLLSAIKDLASTFSETLRAQAEAHTKTIEAVQAGAVEQAKALGDQARSFSAYLEAFRVQEAPQVHVIREQDEYEMEFKRKNAAAPDLLAFVDSSFADIVDG